MNIRQNKRESFMKFKKALLSIILCMSLLFSCIANAGILSKVLKGFVVKECIEIILKNYAKRAVQGLVISYKSKLFDYIRDNPKLKEKVLQEVDNVAKKLISKNKDAEQITNYKNYAQNLKNEINTEFPNSLPKSIKLPKNGIWSGEKGNSRFFPSKVNKNSEKTIKEIYDMNGRTGIKYENGVPKFKNKGELELRNLKGDDSDFQTAFQEIVKNKIEIEGRTFKNIQEVKDYFRKERLTLHHEIDGKTLSIVDRDTHELYRHTGGASKIRNNK